jgi:flagellar basal-body rod protein FlgC
MTYNQIYDIATQGLTAEQLRITVVANNIANQHSIQSNHRTSFHASTVVTTAKPFSTLMNTNNNLGIDTMDVVSEELPPNKVYQPGHPKADPQGYVTYPSVSTVDEMTTLIKASRAYEANIRIMNAAHSLYLQALSIGEER